MKVANKRCIRRLALRNMKNSKMRNIVAMVAIALTSILFTSLFTISMSIVNGFQEAGFRQTGTYSHGAFTRLYKEQYEQLKNASEFKEYGARLLVGDAYEKPFHKDNVEISYCDNHAADYLYLTPKMGKLPKEGTKEAAADTKVLELLGIEPVLGEEFTVTFEVNKQQVTRTFILSGYWEADDLAPANHILISESEAKDICKATPPDVREGLYAGTYDLYFMLDNSRNIKKKEQQILKRYGYQSEERGRDDFISTEENLNYAFASLNESDAEASILILGILLLILFTGYLVIHNIFRIATANDIRRYGLLKTIGTTKRQIRKIVYIESVLLAALGIPIGLVLGYGIGAVLAPIVMKQLNGITILVSASPLIFVLASAFSLFTVLVSSMKPARIAAKASPIEALRYTEQRAVFRKKKRKSRKVSEYRMAVSNVGRNKTKAITTIISLTLAVFVFHITYVLTHSFDMDKYLRDVKADYMVANASYFQANGHLFSEENAVSDNAIQDIQDTGMVAEGGCTYGIGSEQYVYQYVPEEKYEKNMSDMLGNDKEAVDYLLEHTTQIDGRYEDGVNLYGMDEFCLDKVTCIEGDLSKINQGGNYIAAVYYTDNYGNVEKDSCWAEVGDTVTLRYAKSVEFYNPDTGKIYSEEELNNLTEEDVCWDRAVEYHDVTYTVCAAVIVPDRMSYRYHTLDEFILPSDVLLQNYPDAGVMYYAYNVKNANEKGMGAFISDYTTKEMQDYDYESKQELAEDLNSYKQMYLILGGALSVVMGIIGIINFLNVNLTGIFVRRREFAVLQSVGMTGKQLKKMLVTEGLIYALGSLLLAVTVSLVVSPFLKSAIETLFWFCTYRNTVLPVVCLLPVFVIIGVSVPIMIYHFVVKKSIVERLREGES